MTNKRAQPAAWIAATTLALLWAAPAAAQGPAGEPIAVVVHPKNPTKGIKTTTLRAIFTRGQRKWSGGKSIIFINWKVGHKVRKTFDRHVLKMSPQQASAFWIRQRIRGHGRPPMSTTSSLLIRKLVASQSQAVGYLPLKQVGAGVKVLRVDGKLPGDPGYPLRLPAP